MGSLYLHSGQVKRELIMKTPQIKALAINGGIEQSASTSLLLQHVLVELRARGIQTELIDLAGMTIHACSECSECSVQKNRRCVRNDDMGNILIEKMAQADGILFGSSACETDVSPEMKALMERACTVAKANDQLFRHKIGAAVVSMNPCGSDRTFDALNHFFLMNEMVVTGASFRNSDQTGDELETESLAMMDVLGKNFAWLLRTVCGSETIPDLEEILAP